MCSANSVRMFPQKQSNSDTHSLQVLRGWGGGGLFTSTLPSLCTLSVFQLSCCCCLLLVLWKARPILISPSRFQRKPTHPSPPLRHVHSVCASVCLFQRAHVHMLYCILVSVCVWAPACVCTQGGRGWYGLLILHILVCLFIMWHNRFWWPVSQQTFPGRAWQPLQHVHVPVTSMCARLKVMSPSLIPGAKEGGREAEPEPCWSSLV